MSLKREIGRNNIIFVSAGIITVIIGFFSSIVLARFLGPLEFGLYYFFLTVAGFFIIFTEIGTGTSVLRFTSKYFSKKEYGKINSLIRFLLKYRIIISIIVGLILIVFPFQISYFIFNKIEVSLVIQLAGLVLVFNSFFEFSIGFFSGVKDFKYVSILKILDKIFKFSLPVILVIFGFGYIGAIHGLIIASILSVFLVLIAFRKYNFILKSKVAKINKKKILRFGIWSFLIGISLTIFTIIDSFMISILRSVTELGFYRIASMWSFSLVTIVPISGLVLYSYFSRKQSSEILNKTFSNSMRYSLIMILPMAFLLSAFSGSIISSFYGVNYFGSIEVLGILSFVSIPIVLSGIFNGYFSGIGRPDLATKIVLIALIVNIILNYFLIINFGIVGAAIATLVSRLLEVSIYISVVVFISKLTFKISYVLKPLLSSLVIYFIAIQFSVGSILELIIYGLISLAVYIAIMFAIKGINKEDVKFVLSSLRP